MDDLRMIVFLVYFMWISVLVINGCPSECQCHLTDKAVNCYGRELKIIPANIPLDTAVLDLSRNDIDSIPVTTFENLTLITDLVLSENKISKLESQTFQYLKKLEVLNLNTNFLSTIPEGLFDNLPRLKTVILKNNYLLGFSRVFKIINPIQSLNLEGNSIQNVKNPDFRMTTSLVDLNLSKNKISNIELFAFRPLERLSSMSLQKNPLKSADRLLSKNRRLSYIDLSECQLKSVPKGIPNSVQHLQLIKNNITKLRPRDFKNKPFLQILALDENQIDYIEPNTFVKLKNLNQLWLNANRLRKFPSPISSTVTNIYMSKNSITKISIHDFPRNSLLAELVMNDNKIASLTPKTFKNLQHLRRLMINSNRITKLDNNTFQTLKNLELLTLRNNKIDTFEKDCFKGLTSVHELNLASSLVKQVDINGNIFQDLKMLKILDISMSEGLTKAILESAEMLASLRNLIELNVMDNSLNTLAGSTIRQLQNLQKFKLSGNRWHCDQRIRWLKSWLRQRESINMDYTDNLVCRTPTLLRNKKIIDLRRSQFVDITTTMTVSDTHGSRKDELSTTTPDTTPLTTTTETPESFTTETTADKTKMFKIQTSTMLQTTEFYKHNENVRSSDKPVLADGYIADNQTMIINTTMTTEFPETDDTVLLTGSTGGGGNYNLIIIIIATTLSLFVVLVIIIIIIIVCRRREKVVYHRALQYQKDNGDVFFVGDLPPCVATLTKPSRNNSRSRSERGSTSSKPSEDITNELDTTMKIYSLDEE